ncbi:hypothetical protein CVD27_20755 [Neobacillus cucumis]|uniref:Uncharacterized protein n=1 Tax=Neobacillus cucumis TaxID=1740721 RepID=A0A2N5H9V4_9BACI|nr:hypothetical protein CVD27_20755 [Neobacillus cucumis]
MHFRSFIIPALMAGATLFLPHLASAEKPETSGQAQASSHLVEAQPSLKKADHVVTKASVPSKPQQPKPVVEKKPVVPVPTSKAQGQAVQRGLKKAVSEKQDAVPKSLPVQAKGNGNGDSAINRNEKPAVVTTVQVKKSVPVAKPTEAVEVKKTTVPKDPVPVLVTVELKSKKVEHMEPLVPVKPKKDKVPAEKDELPTVDQMLNQTQRTNGSGGGQSNDRVSPNLHTISFLEKWFEWNKDYELMLVQPFLSRYDLKHHQWVNAPPAQPPQTAPFL